MTDLSRSLVEALSSAVVVRRWWCYAENSTCSPEWTEEERHATWHHQSCRWYWSLWTVEQDKIESAYQAALVPVEDT